MTDREYGCGQCQERFGSWEDFDAHRRVHIGGERETTFTPLTIAPEAWYRERDGLSRERLITEVLACHERLDAPEHKSAPEHRAMPTTIPCAHCGNPSVCFGAYESEESIGFACDECCGHGCEDGWCRPIAEAADWMRKARSQLSERKVE